MNGIAGTTKRDRQYGRTRQSDVREEGHRIAKRWTADWRRIGGRLGGSMWRLERNGRCCGHSTWGLRRQKKLARRQRKVLRRQRKGLRAQKAGAAVAERKGCGLSASTLRTQNRVFVEESEEESGRLQIRFVNNRSVVGHPKSRRREVVGNTCLQSGALMPKLPRGWRRTDTR